MPDVQIAALGAEGLRQCPNWRETGLPRASLLAAPAVWQGETLIAAPLAGQENGWKAQIACGSFLSMLFRR
jgi:tRNA(Ile)-lysidine synthase